MFLPNYNFSPHPSFQLHSPPALEPLFTGHVVLARAMNSMLQLAQDTDMTADDNSLVDECQPMPATAATAAYACGPAAGDFAAIPMARTASSGHGQQLPLKSISVVGRSESWPPKRGATVAAAAAAAAMRPSLDVTTAGDTAMECSQPSPTASPPQLYAPTTSGYYAYADYRTGLPRFTSTDSFDGASMFFS